MEKFDSIASMGSTSAIDVQRLVRHIKYIYIYIYILLLIYSKYSLVFFFLFIDSRMKLLLAIQEEYEKMKEINAAKNPFKDVELFVVPMLIAAVAWFISVIVDKTCSTDFCEVCD